MVQCNSIRSADTPWQMMNLIDGTSIQTNGLSLFSCLKIGIFNKRTKNKHCHDEMTFSVSCPVGLVGCHTIIIIIAMSLVANSGHVNPLIRLRFIFMFGLCVWPFDRATVIEARCCTATSNWNRAKKFSSSLPTFTTQTTSLQLASCRDESHH